MMTILMMMMMIIMNYPIKRKYLSVFIVSSMAVHYWYHSHFHRALNKQSCTECPKKVRLVIFGVS